VKADQLAAAAALGIGAALAGCQDAQSPNNATSAEGGAPTHEVQVREPTEKHSCGDHGH
jgi:hypothetical protein